MRRRLAAAAVHLLTATGAVFALLALRSAAESRWQAMFVWLGIALLVDGIDGPLARLVGTSEVLPRWSGERLDLVVDYLTYVAVPAFALAEAHLLPDAWRVAAASLVLLSSLFHFADRKSKSPEGYFVGFPAIWNIVLLYLFLLGLPQWIALGLVVLLALLTFVPLLFVHPVRVARLRPLTLSVTAVWAAAAILAVAHPFPSALWIKVIFILAGLYIVGLGLSSGAGLTRGGRA